nr:MAG TPA: hypothetical protein [Caudoviricetes sp.]
MVICFPPLQKKGTCVPLLFHHCALRRKLVAMAVCVAFRLHRSAKLSGNLGRNHACLPCRENKVFAVYRNEFVALFVGDSNRHSFLLSLLGFFNFCHKKASLKNVGREKPPSLWFNLSKGSVGAVACGIAAAAHYANKALGIEECKAGLEFVADGAELVQRTARLVLVVNNHLQVAACGVNHCVCVCAEEESRVGHTACGVLIRRSSTENRSVCVLNKAHALKLTDFSGEDFGGRIILVRVLPLGVVAKILCHGGVNYGNIAAVNLRHLVLLHFGDDLFNHLAGEQRPARGGCAHKGGTGGSAHNRVAAGGVDVVAIDYVSSGHKEIANKGLVGLVVACAHLLGGGKNNIVISAKLELIGYGYISTVLVNARFDRGHAHFLTGGDYTFLKLFSFFEGVELAPLNLACVLCGKRLMLCELGVVSAHSGVFEQLGVVEILNKRVKCGVSAAECRFCSSVSVDVVLGGIYESTAGNLKVSAFVCKHLQTEIIKSIHIFSFLCSKEKSALSAVLNKAAVRHEDCSLSCRLANAPFYAFALLRRVITWVLFG